MGPWELAYVVDEPEQDIVGLRDGGRKATSAFVGHGDLRLVFVYLATRRDYSQDEEKRKNGSSVKVISERPGRNGTRACRAVP